MQESIAPPPLTEGEWWHLREAVSVYLAAFTEYESSDYADALSVAEKLGLSVDNYPDPSC